MMNIQEFSLFISPIGKLHTDRLILEPLSVSIGDEIIRATKDNLSIFKYLHLDIKQPDALAEWIKTAVQSTSSDMAIHFGLRFKETGAIVGHTAIVNIKPIDRRCEIAWTWLLTQYQGKGLAVESKKALYEFLFSRGTKRVQLLADERNEKSLKSLAASGATREGMLRMNRRTIDGSWQNSVVFSMIDSDWFSQPAFDTRRTTQSS